METMSSTLNQENYDTGCDAYDAYITSEKSYNTFAEIPSMHHLLHTLSGDRILDFCCGTGRYANWMAAQHPNAEVIGVDFSEQSVQAARHKATAHNLTNIQYHTGSIELIKDTYCQYFDGIIWGMGLNYFQDLGVVFDGLQSSLKSQG
jgi:ubiquinone/menaquinone biosynthesis C-methylase UbiE